MLQREFRIWPKLLNNQLIKKTHCLNILLFQHLSSQQLQPPPLPPSAAWAPPHPPKGASPTQPPALSQVPYLYHNLGKSSTSCYVLPSPFQVFTQCQFLTQLNSRHARAAIVMDPLQKQTHIQETLMEAKTNYKLPTPKRAKISVFGPKIPVFWRNFSLAELGGNPPLMEKILLVLFCGFPIKELNRTN